MYTITAAKAADMGGFGALVEGCCEEGADARGRLPGLGLLEEEEEDRPRTGIGPADVGAPNVLRTALNAIGQGQGGGTNLI